MGDHRCFIEIKFEFHGKTYKQTWNINWFPDDSAGVDTRIAEWFRVCAAEGYRRYDEQVAEYWREETERATERQERAELQRLTEKYK